MIVQITESKTKLMGTLHSALIMYEQGLHANQKDGTR